MPRQFVESLCDGEAVDEVYLLSEKQLRANRNADLYLLTSLRDRSGTISGLMWNVTEESTATYDAGQFVRVRGKVQLYQGGLQMILTRVDPVASEQLDLEDFENQPAQDVVEMLDRIRSILGSIENDDLRQLMALFLDDESLMGQFTLAVAGIKVHHAYRGGLVEHVLTILEAARRVSELYPFLDRDLLLAGVFLHDLGKVREISTEGSYFYTDEGQLIGHLVIVVGMLERRLAEFEERIGWPFPEETALRLKHMIVSHHGAYESGSPKLPMTLEAVALHQLDTLDARLHEVNSLIEADPNRDSHWTSFIPRLSRKLFKGGDDAAPAEPTEP